MITQGSMAYIKIKLNSGLPGLVNLTVFFKHLHWQPFLNREDQSTEYREMEFYIY